MAKKETLLDFRSAIKKLLGTSKGESDRQLAEFQAANAQKRTGAKRGRKPKK